MFWPQISLQEIYHTDILTKVYHDINSRMFIVALFEIENFWKPPKLSRVLFKVDFGKLFLCNHYKRRDDFYYVFK